MNKEIVDKLWEELKRLDEYSKVLEGVIIRGDEKEMKRVREMLVGEEVR